jgi:antagonist of KipI
MASGDRVRFVPVSGEQTQLPDAPRTKGEGSGGDLASNADGPSRASFGPTITVVKPGLLSTIQDRGRWGYQHIGVSVSGAMDLQSHRLANSLVGNGPDAATVEATLVGPELRMETDAVVAITGADVAVSLDGSSVPGHTPLHARAGNVLRFGPRRGGGRAYVAFSGGIQTPGVLGSAATHTRTSMGGIDGRALRAGDRLRLGSANVQRTAPSTGLEPVVVSNGARLRVLTGPQEDLFPSSALEILLGSRFVLSPESDRMGFRLTGERPIPRLAGREMISDVTVTGGIQVPASGQPIVLMADRPTTGGYPQLAVVITADLPRAGQLVPGDWVEFELSSMRDALAALSGQSDGDGGQSSVC